PTTGAIVFSTVGYAPINATSFTVDILPPCGSWLYRVAAVGPSGSRASTTVSVTTEVIAYVLVTEGVGILPIPAGSYEITCQGHPVTGKGVALYDRNGNGTATTAPAYVNMPVGASNRLYPRELALVGTGLQNLRGGSFSSLVG